MKPHPLTDCLLRLTDAANMAVYAIYLAARPRGLMPPSQHLADAMMWQRNRLFWARCYSGHMAALSASPLS